MLSQQSMLLSNQYTFEHASSPPLAVGLIIAHWCVFLITQNRFYQENSFLNLCLISSWVGLIPQTPRKSLSMKDDHISRSSWCTRSFMGILPFHQNLHTSSLPHVPPEGTCNINSIAAEPHVSWTPSFPVQPACGINFQCQWQPPLPYRSVSESTSRSDSPTTPTTHHVVAEQQDCFLLAPVSTFWYVLYWIGSHPQLMHLAIQHRTTER